LGEMSEASAPTDAAPSLSAVMGVSGGADPPAPPPAASGEPAVAVQAEKDTLETVENTVEAPEPEPQETEQAAPDPNSFAYLLDPPPPSDNAPTLISMGLVRSRAVVMAADPGGLKEGPALTAEEREVLRQVRAKGGEEIEDMSNELLTRCLRGYADYPDRVGDTAAAILKIVRWRKEMDMENLLGQKLEHHEAFNCNWECTVCGTDSDGHVIQYESLATIKTSQLSANIENGTVPLEALVKQRAQVYEAVDEYKKLECARRIKGGSVIGRRNKSVYIFDLKGFSFSLLTAKIRLILKAVIGVGGDYFPEAMATMYLINAPMAFRAAWAVISPWLHKITRDKIHILGNQAKYMPAFKAAGVSLDQLPTIMGGTCPGVMAADLVLQSPQ